MDGLYDILNEYSLEYNKLLNLLYKLSKIVPLDYARIEKELDQIYDHNEYQMFVNNKNKGA